MERQPESRHGENVERDYANERLRVKWEPRLCVHVGYCTRMLPNVFRPAERPWVDVDAADPDELAKVIEMCPTGALHYERLDGGPQEEPPATTEITVQKGGPLYIRGEVRMTDHRGNVLREDTRMALCRCGRSSNKPFCDGTHDTFLFR